MLRNLAIATGLALAVWLVFGQTLGFDAVRIDDPGYVFENRDLRTGGLRAAFTRVVLGNWHPLTQASFLADHAVFGLDPRGYHATNVVLHMLNTWLLWALLQGATRRVWASAAVALLFAVHPLHVESVAWISGRKDLLSTLFGLAAFGAYADWTRRGGVPRYLLCAALLVASLMSKSMLVTFPLLALVVDRWPLGRSEGLRERVVEKLPLFGIALASAAITVWSQLPHGGALGDSRVALSNLPNALVAYATYLGMLVWPTDLSVLYPHPDLPWRGNTSYSALRIGGSVALGVAISWAVVRAHQDQARAGWLWFVVSLLPVIGLLRIGEQAYADRYTYVPAIGVFAIACFGVDDLRRRLAGRLPALQPVLAVGVVAVLGGYAIAARNATAVWRDSETLLEHALRVHPDNVAVLHALGRTHHDAGRIDAAASLYLRALEVYPEHAPSLRGLGNARAMQGRHAEAVEHYRAALRLAPEDPATHNDLANSLLGLGELDLALEHLQQSIVLAEGIGQPSAPPWYHLARVLAHRGQAARAELSYRRALEIDPGFAPARRAYARWLEEQGRGAEASALLESAPRP